jgi:hypothetical protein
MEQLTTRQRKKLCPFLNMSQVTLLSLEVWPERVCGGTTFS